MFLSDFAMHYKTLNRGPVPVEPERLHALCQRVYSEALALFVGDLFFLSGVDALTIGGRNLCEKTCSGLQKTCSGLQKWIKG